MPSPNEIRAAALSAVRRTHNEIDWFNNRQVCRFDRLDWPCHTIRLADACESLLAENERLHRSLEQLVVDRGREMLMHVPELCGTTDTARRMAEVVVLQVKAHNDGIRNFARSLLGIPADDPSPLEGSR